MAESVLLSPDFIKQCVRYEPETGKLYWRERPAHLFLYRSDAKGWNRKHAGRETFTFRLPNGYLQGAVKKVHLYAHRVAWAIAKGYWPLEIDHINGIKDDNRLINLREVTTTQNRQNGRLHRDNTSGVIGVTWREKFKTWRVRIVVNKKEVCLGCFKNFDEAVAVRKLANIKHGFHPNHGRHSVTRG